ERDGLLRDALAALSRGGRGARAPGDTWRGGGLGRPPRDRRREEGGRSMGRGLPLDVGLVVGALRPGPPAAAHRRRRHNQPDDRERSAPRAVPRDLPALRPGNSRPRSLPEDTRAMRGEGDSALPIDLTAPCATISRTAARSTETGGTTVTRITGVLSPVVTPFAPAFAPPFGADRAPDAQRFARHCRWLLSQNVGLAVFGTNSEANSLAVEEKIELLDGLVAAGLDPTRMMPGTGCCALPDSVRLTAHAMKLGCGGVLMLPPFYYKGVSDDGLFRSFAEVIERVGEGRPRL